MTVGLDDVSRSWVCIGGPRVQSVSLQIARSMRECVFAQEWETFLLVPPFESIWAVGLFLLSEALIVSLIGPRMSPPCVAVAARSKFHTMFDPKRGASGRYPTPE